MPTTARALGRLFDISSALGIVDLNTAANTGNRIHMKNYAGVTFVFFADAGTDDGDVAMDLNEHTAASGGTSQDLDIITTYHKKEETTLDGDETWTAVTQTAASEITAVADSAEKENIYVVEVGAEQLSDGYEWISMNVPDLGQAKVGGVLAILWGLKAERTPANLPDPNA